MLLDIKDLDKLKVLSKLYELAVDKTYEILESMDFYVGVKALEYNPEKAKELLSKGGVISSFAGRELQVDLSGDSVEIDAYDAINGQGKAEQAISAARK